MASDPELAKKNVSIGSGHTSASRAPSCSSRPWRYTFTWAWISRSACWQMAATTLGWQCPVEVTAMPLVKSRYSSPSVVVITQPRPDATSRSVTRNQTSETWLTNGYFPRPNGLKIVGGEDLNASLWNFYKARTGEN